MNAITIQAIYLRLDTIADELLNSEPRSLDAMLFSMPRKSGKRSVDIKARYNTVTSISQGLSFLMHKEFNLMTDLLYDCFDDEEIEDWNAHDYDFIEDSNSISFIFRIENVKALGISTSSKWAEEKGLFINKIETIDNKEFCHVTILKMEMGEYVIKILDNNPIIFM